MIVSILNQNLPLIIKQIYSMFLGHYCLLRKGINKTWVLSPFLLICFRQYCSLIQLLWMEVQLTLDCVHVGDYSAYPLSCSVWRTWVFSRWLARTGSFSVLCVSFLSSHIFLEFAQWIRSQETISFCIFICQVVSASFKPDSLLWILYRYQRSTTAISVGNIICPVLFSAPMSNWLHSC